VVLVDVGIEGCTACRWMDETTYADPEVATLVARHFVAIAVDAEARPDVGERYEAWGWPATIFMSPGGEQVLGDDPDDARARALHAAALKTDPADVLAAAARFAGLRS
jgi:thiol:disulfide interchange protein